MRWLSSAYKIRYKVTHCTVDFAKNIFSSVYRLKRLRDSYRRCFAVKFDLTQNWKLFKMLRNWFYILPGNSCMSYLSFKNGFNYHQKIQIRRLQGCMSDFCICKSGQYQKWNSCWYKKPIRNFIFDYFNYDWYVLFNSLGPGCLVIWSEFPCLCLFHLI